MADTDPFCTLEILALTAIGESEDLGEVGMTQTINTIMNRAAADIGWMGGNDARAVCLQKGQYDCWWPQINNDDRERIIKIALDNTTYGPYRIALQLAEKALAGNLPDTVNGAVSYADDGEKPDVHPGSQPCLVVGSRTFYGLEAVA